MIVFVATPLEAVALPLPLTVPIPDCLAKAITVELSEVTMLPAASWIVAVSTPGRAGGQVRRRAAERDLGCSTGDDVERAERAGRKPARGGLHRDGAGDLPGDRLRRDAAGGGGVACAADGAGAALLRKCDDGRVVGGDGVAGGVLDRRGQHTRGARGEVGSRARQSDLGRGAVDDRERAECPRRQPGGGCLHRDGACELSGDRLGGDTVRNGRVAGAGHRAHARLLRERDRGRAVREDCVPGGIAERRGQQHASPRRSGWPVDPATAI